MNLKKMIFSVILLSLSGLACFSQTNFGVSAGVNYSHWNQNLWHVEGRPGYSYGVFMTKNVGSSFLIRADVEYLQTGGSLLLFEDNTRYGMDGSDTPFPIRTRDSKTDLQTLNVPINFSYLLLNSDGATISIGVGPEVAYLLQAVSNETITAEKDQVFYTWSETSNATNNYAALQYGASAIAQITIPVGSKTLSTSFRYRFIINPIRSGYSYVDYTNVSSDIQQGTFIVSFGLGL